MSNCSSGLCGIRRTQPPIRHDDPSVGCCADCVQERYRQRMRNANPWSTNPWNNGGKILSEEGTDSGGTPATNAPATNAYDLALAGFREIGRTARAQIDAGNTAAETAEQREARIALAADQLARDTRTGRYASTASGAASGGGGGVLILALLAGLAAVMSGAVKVGK